ncbi:MAG TPA: glycosyltransferase family 2 protein [Mycobacteriales bacterium]
MADTRVLFVVTVYNGANVVPPCLRSAARAATESATDCDVLVLDDASPEPGFSEHIERLCAELDIQYYRSPRNLGIPRNVNVGLLRAVEAGYDYVLIANSDVLFGQHTIDRMVEVFATNEKIGSATAWSNNVSIYSLPNSDPDQHLSNQAFVDWLGDVTADEFGPAAVDIPAGISFCVLIPTEVLRVVGLMDPVFGRGYCEETDWTLRSQELGYRIALAPSAFVYHQGQGSNQDAGIIASGHTSVPAHERIVDLRYPLFREQVEGFVNSEILDMLWNSARRAIMTTAAREWGYRIEIGLSMQSGEPTAGPRVTFERVAGPLNPVAKFRGFRMELPVPVHLSDPVQSIIEFFGREPEAVQLADHSALSSEMAEAARRAGFGVRSELGYPLHV